MLKFSSKTQALYAVLAVISFMALAAYSMFRAHDGEPAAPAEQGGYTVPADASEDASGDALEDMSDGEGSAPQNIELENVEGAMRNVSLDAVPSGYYSAASQQGTLETFTYSTKNYSGNGAVIQRNATVYLPYGYDRNDFATRYNIIYLQHGAYGNERTWMYEYGVDFKNMIDHMIEDGSIPPVIIAMPYLTPGNSWYHDTTPIFYSSEIRNDLMPVVETHYHTYAQDVSDAGLAASRSHRAFAGFSAGATTTWTVFLEGLDCFEYFMPMSGGLTLGGDGSTGAQDASQLEDAALNCGYGKREYYIFSATGTRDVAYQGLTAQIERMKPLMDAFDFTETGFADGNLMYYTVEGNWHDYPYTYEYVYNGLRCLFSWAVEAQ